LPYKKSAGLYIAMFQLAPKSLEACGERDPRLAIHTDRTDRR
jgi:hypothetical protein